MYELTECNTIKASHDYENDFDKSYIDTDGSWVNVFVEKNTELMQHINDAVNEAITNYDCEL